MRKACWMVALVLAPTLGAQTFARQTRSVFDPPPPTSPATLFDVDDDGDVDVLTRGGQCYRNDGHGRFTLHSPLPQVIQGLAVVHGDLDGDGDQDLIIGAAIYDNDGTGQFQYRASLPGLLARVRLADTDGDGDLDAVYVGSTLRLFSNDGSGNFSDVTAAVLPAPISAGDALAFDADRDGDLDIFYVGGNQPGLLRNDGTGVFAAETMAHLPLLLLNRMLAGDFDGDGDLDVWVSGLITLNHVLINDGTGAFQLAAQPISPSPFWLGQASTLDWDQDGYTDLAAYGGIFRFGPGAVPTFRRLSYVWEGSGSLVADIDGDLDEDVLFTSLTDSGFIVRNAWPDLHPVSRPMLPERLPFTAFYGARSQSPGRYDQQILVGNGQPHMLNSSAATFAYGYQPLLRYPLAGQFAITDAALVTNRFQPHWTQLVACTASGPILQQWNVSALIEMSQILPAIGSPQHVGTGQLDGIVGDEIVFGDAAHDGPRILTRQLSGMFVEIGPSLPPATPSTTPAHETVVIADFDGDGHGDILHEQRILRSDGQGGWTIMADVSSLVSAAAERFVAIDYDHDGDADLLAYGSSATTQLLRNDGATFADVTIGTIPPPEYAATSLVTAGDLDGDGDLDLLTTRGDRSHALRNDGGVFVRVPDVAPFGALVDVDLDGRADILTGDGVFTNLRTNLFAPFPAIPGTDWRLDLRTWRPVPSATLAVVAIGTQELPVTVAGIGEVFVDLASADLFALPMAQGLGSVTLPIPSSVLLLGTDLVAQGVVVDGAGVELTAPVRDSIR